MSTNIRPPAGVAPSKKPYTRPALTRIRLQPEEAVLGTCKVDAGSSGHGPSGCALCGLNSYSPS
jgi:hypothetical protein